VPLHFDPRAGIDLAVDESVRIAFEGGAVHPLTPNFFWR
jgi:hypothetical protein